MKWLFNSFLNLPPFAEAFRAAVPEPAQFVDPYQTVIDRCQRHPKDPTVLITRHREDLEAIKSPCVSAVVWVRDVSDKLKEEIARLQASADIHDVTEAYEWNPSPPESIPLIRDDMRMIAHLRAALAGEILTKPILIARSSEKVDLTAERFKSTMATDHDFHSDRGDVGLRLHTTYSGPCIQGLALSAVERLEKSQIITAPLWKEESQTLLKNLSPDDIIDDIPLYAVVAFKGQGYHGPNFGESAPPHNFWRHRGPDRDRSDGVAAIFGLPYLQARRYDLSTDFPDAKI